MLVLSFGKSTFPKFRDTVKLAEKFTSCAKTDNRTSVTLPVKEVFEKWEYFNQLFWTVVDCKEATANLLIDLHTIKRQQCKN